MVSLTLGAYQSWATERVKEWVREATDKAVNQAALQVPSYPPQQCIKGSSLWFWQISCLLIHWSDGTGLFTQAGNICCYCSSELTEPFLNCSRCGEPNAGSDISIHKAPKKSTWMNEWMNRNTQINKFFSITLNLEGARGGRLSFTADLKSNWEFPCFGGLQKSHVIYCTQINHNIMTTSRILCWSSFCSQNGPDPSRPGLH